MDRHYFLHRISYEWEASYALLKNGYLSLGWSKYKNSDVLERARLSESTFNDLMSESNNNQRSRWSMWYFAKFEVHDYILVPLFNKEFGIYEVEEPAKSIISLKGMSFELENKEIGVIDDEEGLYSQNTNKKYDIGFIVKVKEIKRAKRTYADGLLNSRMKIRQTTSRIDSLKESVEEAKNANAPINIHSKLLSGILGPTNQVFHKYLTDITFEKTVRWYMEKKGADRAWITAKYNPQKKDKADVDIIAEFDDLGVIYYIQVKHHEGVTGEWAVDQIIKYSEQFKLEKENYICISWVISLADDYDDAAKEKASKNNVRLINANEFIKMVLDVGIEGIEEATEYTIIEEDM